MGWWWQGSGGGVRVGELRGFDLRVGWWDRVGIGVRVR